MALSGGGIDPANLNLSGIPSIFSGLFNDSGAPYQAGMDQLSQYYNQAQNYQNPFYKAGTNAIPQYQNWLSQMQNPTNFINNLMSQYQQSPYAKYQQNQAVRAGQNAASASGLTGSTPFAQQLEQNAQNISSQDMQSWLQNVLGINSQYGMGQQNLIGVGQNSANALTNSANQMGQNMAQGAYGQAAAQQQGWGNLVGGLFNFFGF